MNLFLTLNNPPLGQKSMKDLFKPLNQVIHNAPIMRSRKVNYNANEHSKGKVLTFDKTFQLYLDDVEKITHRPLHPYQHEQIKYHLEHQSYTKLSPDASRRHRKDFGDKKANIVQDWEKMTGQKWPVYDKPVYNSNGKMIRPTGANYDIHHMIENSFGGNNEAWNMHPARHPDEHQQQIHRKGGFADKIFDS